MSAAKAVEVAAEEIVEVVEAAERIPSLALNGTTRKQQIIILAVTAIAGAAAGSGVSFTVLKRKLKNHYEAVATKEIDEAREFFEAVHNKPELSDLAQDLLPEEMAQMKDPGLVRAATAMREYRGEHDMTALTRPAAPVPVEEPVTTNIFVEGTPMDDNFDYEAEVARRSEDEPYIISKDEYNQGEKEYTQQELTFYEGDDTLADDKGKHIPDADDVVGDMNLHRFGHGSGDNNVLYVRNDRLELDFVVLRSTGEYSKEVLGLRHSGSGSRKRPRFRGDDE